MLKLPDVDKKQEEAIRIFRDMEGYSMEQILMALSYFGEPRVGFPGGEWYANMDIEGITGGVSITIRSGYDHSNPLNAVQALAEKLIEVVDLSLGSP